MENSPTPPKRNPAVTAYFSAHRPGGLKARLARASQDASTRPKPSLARVLWLERAPADEGDAS
jgi:hypothetical protein